MTQKRVDIVKYDSNGESQYRQVESGDARKIVAKHETHSKNRLIVAAIIGGAVALFTGGIALVLGELIYWIAGIGVAIGLLAREKIGGPSIPEVEATDITRDQARDEYEI